MLSASSYGHFTAAKGFPSQCHIFRFGNMKDIIELIGIVELEGLVESEGLVVLKGTEELILVELKGLVEVEGRVELKSLGTPQPRVYPVMDDP